MKGMVEIRKKKGKARHKAVINALRRKEYKDMPVLIAFKTLDGSQLAAWCPYCRKWHYHGLGEGHRITHCNSGAKSPFERTGYILVEGKGRVKAKENWHEGKYKPWTRGGI